MSEHDKIEEAERRALAAEAAANRAQIRIEILTVKTEEMERMAHERIKAAATGAVAALIQIGKIKTAWERITFMGQFLHDPSLIELTFTKPANRKKI
jgi:nucleoside-triphosphatase THEP1